MKASLVTYDFRKLHKKLGIKIINHGIYQRLPKIANNPNLIAQNFRD